MEHPTRGLEVGMDEALRAELLEMERMDRAMRADLVARGELHRPGYHPEMEAVHRRHNARIRAIIDARGWPGYSLVGEDGCRAAGFVVQHAILDHDLQRRCVGLLREAVERGEAAPFMLAMLTDRVLMDEGQPQIYGTQYVGSKDGWIEPWPIAEPDTVDERRAAVGLPSMAENEAHIDARHREETSIMDERPSAYDLSAFDATGLFSDERRALLDLLAGLTDEQWATPTACLGWTVKDVALHVLGVDLGNLSVQRDGFVDASTAGPTGDGWASLVAFVDGLNETWIVAARRLSPRLLRELLAVTGPAIADYFGGLDLMATGHPVVWAGPDPAPVWLHVAREYTERWVHQQQIRDALGAPGFAERECLAPVLAAFVHAVPHTLRRVPAAPGTRVRLSIEGPAGARWLALKAGDGWALGRDDGGPADATVALDQDLAWRLFTKGVAPADALPRARIEGDRPLGRAVLDTVSIIA